MIILIAALSGRELSLDLAKEFLFSLSGIGAGGFALRTIAQQAVKLFNIIFPAAGSAVSAGIASTGTWSMGHLAIEYYIRGKDLETVKKSFKNITKKFKKDAKKMK